MPDISLKDVLISARQESHRMRHFFIGVEHLFIALLEIKGSITGKIIQEYGLTSEYVIDAIRRKAGKGSKHRLWAGVPNTPRANVVLGIARDIALENGREDVLERDILMSILDESDSVPLRVLAALGLDDTEKLKEKARTLTVDTDSRQPYVKVDFGDAFDRDDMLSKDQLFILRRMFYGYNQIRVERRLKGGYTDAVLLVVTPIHVDHREDSPVVVKINSVDDILDEAQRYELHVKSKLPAMTARLEDKPIAPETSDLAGIKYTLVAGYDRKPSELRTAMKNWDDPLRIGSWLENELFPVFGRIWWQQSRPYRFQVWREYDWLLPPIVTLEMLKEPEIPPDAHRLKVPLNRTRISKMDYGDTVVVENFIVQRVIPERKSLILAAGHGTDSSQAYKVEVRNVDFSNNTYYRGEVIDTLVGRVWKTRQEHLLQALNALDPDFDTKSDFIPFQLGGIEKLPNPITVYESFLDDYVNGSLSTIHGDLHPGNIMIGPNQSAFLVDFGHTREGHNVFDWAVLEASLLADYVMPKAGSGWDEARQIVEQLSRINGGAHPNKPQLPYSRAMLTLLNVRHIVRQCLAEPSIWSEYYIALAFSSLRSLQWPTMPPEGRKLLFMVAALSMHELKTRHRFVSDTATPSPEETDIKPV